MRSILVDLYIVMYRKAMLIIHNAHEIKFNIESEHEQFGLSVRLTRPCAIEKSFYATIKRNNSYWTVAVETSFEFRSEEEERGNLSLM